MPRSSKILQIAYDALFYSTEITFFDEKGGLLRR